MTKGTAASGHISGGPEKGRAISYFNQIISRTMGPTGEKSSFASCFCSPVGDRCPLTSPRPSAEGGCGSAALGMDPCSLANLYRAKL
jgi:hypothetical protein